SATVFPRENLRLGTKSESTRSAPPSTTAIPTRATSTRAIMTSIAIPLLLPSADRTASRSRWETHVPELVQIHVRRYRARSEGCFTEGGTPRDESFRAHLAVPSPGEVPALAVVGRGARPPARAAALGRDGEPRVGDAHLCRESCDALSL